jgi:hypothetical protein
MSEGAPDYGPLVARLRKSSTAYEVAMTDLLMSDRKPGQPLTNEQRAIVGIAFLALQEVADWIERDPEFFAGRVEERVGVMA